MITVREYLEDLQKQLKSHVEYEKTLLEELFSRQKKIDALLQDVASRDLAIAGLREVQAKEEETKHDAKVIIGELAIANRQFATTTFQLEYALYSALEDSRWISWTEEIYDYIRGVYVVWTLKDKLEIVVYDPARINSVFPECRRFFRLPDAEENELRKDVNRYMQFMYQDDDDRMPPIEDMVCADEECCPGCAEECFKAKPSATDSLIGYIGGGDDEE